MGILYMLLTQPMEALSQLDVHSPDHVSVITRDGKMTVSVTKDGAAVTVSLPIRTTFDTTPRPPLQQPELRQYKVKEVIKNEHQTSKEKAEKRKRDWNTASKLNESQVREIKMMLADEELMKKFGMFTTACHEIGKAYSVSGATVGNIARGVSWKNVKI